jgi:toxin secretion/phage lysis holin
MVIDYATGFMVAAVFKKSRKSTNGALNSHIGWMGLCKKGVILAMVLIAHRLDLTLGTDYIRNVVIIGYITNEVISLVENVGLMGVKIPPVVVKVIDVLKSKSEEEGEK